MEAAGLTIAIVGLCADIRARLESARSAPRMTQGLLGRIELAQDSLSRLATIVNSQPASSSPSLATEAVRHEPLRRLGASLQDLSATTERLHNDLYGRSWQRFRSRLPFALDPAKAQNYERKLDQLLADITVYTTTTNLEQVSAMVTEFRKLNISNQVLGQEAQRDGFNLRFHIGNVPYIHHFEGRKEYLNHLANTLLPGVSPERRKLEIISGLGGIGKTQLAIQFANSFEDQFSSIFFIDANSQESLSRSFHGIYKRLWGDYNKRESAAAEGPETLDTRMIDEVLKWFCLKGNTQWLLIFDNVDRQPSDPDGVNIATFFPPVRGSILVTTRLNPLKVDGLSKLQITLQPMTPDESKNLLDYYLAMRLGTDSTASASHSTRTEEQDNLLSRLAGLPLALAQAGSFLRATKMPVTQYLDHYDNSRRQLLESHRPLFETEDGSRRANIGTTWSMSVSLLHDMAQRAGPDTRYRNALKLLFLITYFDPTDIEFEIIQRGLVVHNVPGWFEEVFRTDLSFVTTAEILVERSLLNPTSKYGSYSMHRVVYDWLCAFNAEEPDEELIGLAVCATAFSAPGRMARSWKDREKRLIVHILAMENRLLRCKFESGVPMVEFGKLPPAQYQRAMVLLRDPGWYRERSGTAQPLALISYLFSVIGKTQTGHQILDAALATCSNGEAQGSCSDTRANVALLHGKAILHLHQEDCAAARSWVQRTAAVARKFNLQQDLCDLKITNGSITRKEGNSLLAIQILKQCVQDCTDFGFSLYHPVMWSAVMELTQALEMGGESGAQQRIDLLAPYRAEAEKNAPHDAKARTILGLLGAAYRKVNATSDALMVLKAALEAELANGGTLGELDDLYFDLSRAYVGVDNSQAVDLCEKWVEVRLARFGTEGVKTAYALSDLCRIRQEAQPDDPRALQVGLQAAAIIDADDGREYWRISERVRDAYMAAESWNDAIIWGRRTADGSRSEFGPRTWDYAFDLQCLGEIYEKGGDLESARVCYEEALDIWNGIGDSDSRAKAQAVQSKLMAMSLGVEP